MLKAEVIIELHILFTKTIPVCTFVRKLAWKRIAKAREQKNAGMGCVSLFLITRFFNNAFQVVVFPDLA